MYDHDIFAVLTPKDEKNRAHTAFGLAHNSKWFHGATGGVAAAPIIDSRETTPAYQNDEESANARLVLRFGKLLESDLTDGIRFGTDPKSCHVLLGHRGTEGVSRLQYNITVDDDLCIWLHDVRSTHGTAVGYDGQCKDQIRKKETWILSHGPGYGNPFGEIQIYAGNLSFQIEFPNHEKRDARYIQNLQEFVEKRKGLPTVENLDVQSVPTTLAPSEAQTPGNGALYFKNKVIGNGVFGQVSSVIRLRDGALFAAKTFHLPPKKRKRDSSASSATRKIERMREEFDTMMRNTHHPNIVKAIEFHEAPIPQLILEYYPLGNWKDANIHHEGDCVTGLGQLLEGLRHLHINGIAHRDLKPENILVARNPYLRFAIGDFGLSKIFADKTLLTTFCGSPKYTAPEVFPGLADSYEASVDIWSLGVLILEAVYGLPEEPKSPKSNRHWKEWIISWSKSLRDRLDDRDEDVLVTILDDMVKFEPEKRLDAYSCLKRGFKEGLFETRAVDGLVVCHTFPSLEKRFSGTTTPKARSPSAAYPSPQPEASTVSNETHLSTRQLFFVSGLVCMVVRRQRISMRASTLQLNASEILKAALPRGEGGHRHHFMSKLRERKVVDQAGDSAWVPFREGVFLCQRLGLDTEVQPLLSYPSVTLPEREDNYLYGRLKSARYRDLEENPRHGYAAMRCGEVMITYRPAEKMINARHILEAGGIHPARLRLFFKKNPDITKEIHSGNKPQGTYISYEHAPALCALFNLDLDPVKRLISQTEGSTDRDEPVDIPSDPAVRIGQNDPSVVFLGSINNPSGSDNDDSGSMASRDYFIQPDFRYGSYLAPADQSHLQVLETARMPRSGVTPPPLPYDTCPDGDMENSLGDWAEFFSDACDTTC